MAATTSLYYEAVSPVGFETMPKIRVAEAAERKGKPQSVGAIKACLKEQDAYKLERPVMKSFARNTYTVTNVMDVWKSDLLDVHAYAKYNDNYKYVLSVLDVFSTFLFLIPVETKRGTAVTTAFRSIFEDDTKKHSRLPYGYERIRARYS